MISKTIGFRDTQHFQTHPPETPETEALQDVHTVVVHLRKLGLDAITLARGETSDIPGDPWINMGH